MKIIAPIRSEEQVDIFIQGGADEFYCGFMYDKWEQQYSSEIEYNRRGNFAEKANIRDIEKLEAIISASNHYNKKVFLTTNALRITQKQADLLEDLFKSFKKMGGHGVIISDLTLIDRVKQLDLFVVLSSCANVNNLQSALFFKNLGVDRIIFPRDITLNDIGNIISGCPAVEFESFLMNSACKFVDGNCLGLHNSKYKSLCKFIDRCERQSYYTLKEHEEFMSDKIMENNDYYKSLFNNACGLCALFDLINCGVHSVKIVGRMLPNDQLYNDIKNTGENITIAKHSKNREEYLNNMKFIDSTEEKIICSNGFNCYYPDIYNCIQGCGR